MVVAALAGAARHRGHGAEVLLPGARGSADASASASASSAIATPAPTAITALPLPKSASAEAIASYRSGVQALRDASWGTADQYFLRATELDPDMALAHLRAAYTAKYGRPTEVRRHFARAIDLRASLSERDRAFLSSLEPLLVGDPAEPGRIAAPAEGRVREISRGRGAGRYALFAGFSQDDQAALEMARRAIALDPEYADAWQQVAVVSERLGAMTEARQALDRCVEVAPGATDCQVDLAGSTSSTADAIASSCAIAR